MKRLILLVLLVTVQTGARPARLPRPLVTPGIVLMGIGLSAGVGLAAGYWPARSASNLPVVDALRAE